VIDSLLSTRKPLTRVRHVGNPVLRIASEVLRVLMILVLRFLTPGLYLAVLFETVRAQPANERAAKADLTAQSAARERSGASPTTTT
jgi:hypothetical protein